MTPLRRSRWTAAVIALATMAAWLVASNHCAIASLQPPAKAGHACCHEKDAGPKPVAPRSMECCDVSNVPVPVQAIAPAGQFFELPAIAEDALADFSPAHLRDAAVATRAHDPPPAASFAETVLNRSLLAHAPPVFVA